MISFKPKKIRSQAPLFNINRARSCKRSRRTSSIIYLVRKSIYYLLITITFILVGWFANTAYHLPRSANNPLSEIKPRPLDKYTIENLGSAKVDPAKFETGKVLKDDPKITTYEFFMSFHPSLSDKKGKRVSGVLNVPK